MTIVWLNVGLIPLALFYRNRLVPFVKNKGGLSSLLPSTIISRFLIVWALTALIFFSLSVFLTAHYVFTILIPVVIGLGLVTSRERKWVAIVGVSYLIISAGVACLWKYDGANEAIDYLEKNLRQNDTVVASHSPVFRYCFREHVVYDADADKILNNNATYLVLFGKDMPGLLENRTLDGFIKSNYTLSYITHGEVYYIYKLDMNGCA
jgi:hypothetical protein